MSQSDSLRELSELLLGAKKRYRTARATVHHALNGTLATEADRRFYGYARRRGMVYYFGALAPEDGSLPEGAPGHLTFDDSDEISRVWHEPPRRWRQETYPSGIGPRVGRSGTLFTTDPRIAYQVADGEEGRWWTYNPYRGVADRFIGYPGLRRQPPELAYLLDPSEERFYSELLDTELEVVGAGERAGHEILEILAKTVSWDHPPWNEPFIAGADHHRLSVGAEAGIILRFSAQMDGREIYVAEVTEVTFDEDFPEGIFRLDLPGMEA